VTSTFSITLDFISQVILVSLTTLNPGLTLEPLLGQIYRCWIVWGRRLWVIALPALLAVTSWSALYRLRAGPLDWGADWFDSHRTLRHN
jgi:hypothetical protein